MDQYFFPAFTFLCFYVSISCDYDGKIKCEALHKWHNRGQYNITAGCGVRSAAVIYNISLL